MLFRSPSDRNREVTFGSLPLSQKAFQKGGKKRSSDLLGETSELLHDQDAVSLLGCKSLGWGVGEKGRVAAGRRGTEAALPLGVLYADFPARLLAAGCSLRPSAVAEASAHHPPQPHPPPHLSGKLV